MTSASVIPSKAASGHTLSDHNETKLAAGLVLHLPAIA